MTNMEGYLINSEYSDDDEENSVSLHFSGCRYDSNFGAHPPDGRQIAATNFYVKLWEAAPARK